MPPSKARIERNYRYCQSIKDRCGNEGQDLNNLFFKFIKTVNETAVNFFPKSDAERRKCNMCLDALTDFPHSFPDDFTLEYEDAQLGASLVRCTGEAMQELRSEYPVVASGRDVKCVYTELCRCLRDTFTLRYNRDGSDREYNPNRKSYHDENACVPGPPSEQLLWSYGFCKHEPDDADFWWGAMVDAEYYVENLRPIGAYCVE
jgi:hypothetical protein